MNNYLCIDIGGTAIKYGIFDEAGGKIAAIAADQTDNRLPESNILNTLRRKIAALRQQFSLAGICISSAGVVDPQAGRIVYAGYTIPDYTGTDLKAVLEAEFGLPCEVENDVNAACLGEYWQGVLQGAESAVCLTVGTGIGGAVLLQGEIFHGISWTAGEVGYMQVAGQPFQELAATSKLVERVNRRKGTSLSGAEIFDLAQAGDQICVEEIAVLTSGLCSGIVNILYLLNPQRLVLGGAIMAQERYLRPQLEAGIAARVQDPRFAQTELHFAKLKNDAGMVGALYNFKKRQ